MRHDKNSPYYYRSDCKECHGPQPCFPDKCTFDKCDDCLRPSHVVILPKNSVGPCGKTGELDLSSINDYSICVDGDIFHKVVQYDTEGFSSVSIDDSNGLKVYFTTSQDAVVGEVYTITYKVVCIESGIGAFGTIQVFIKDLCAYTECEECDRCTGECIGNVDITTD